jgi:hypothetical protein
MRINNEMRRHRDTVTRRTLNGETHQGGAGTFIMNGQPISRNACLGSNPKDTKKYLLCGTCGVLLSINNLKVCTKCKQLEINEDIYMTKVADDWQSRKLDMQHVNPNKFISRRNYTDEISTVTSAAETYLAAEEAFETQCKLSISNRLSPSKHKLTTPVDPGPKYRKFLSGMGMQEPWEKVYSQGERLWLPSRAGQSRQKLLQVGTEEDFTDEKVDRVAFSSKLRKFGNQDAPHHTHRALNLRTMKVDLNRGKKMKTAPSSLT